MRCASGRIAGPASSWSAALHRREFAGSLSSISDPLHRGRAGGGARNPTHQTQRVRKRYTETRTLVTAASRSSGWRFTQPDISNTQVTQRNPETTSLKSPLHRGRVDEGARNTTHRTHTHTLHKSVSTKFARVEVRVTQDTSTSTATVGTKTQDQPANQKRLRPIAVDSRVKSQSRHGPAWRAGGRCLDGTQSLLVEVESA